ncbi:MAG: hypothetical protein Q9182_002751 [Xanthomendoza sp. 2 TL-2023]
MVSPLYQATHDHVKKSKVLKENSHTEMLVEGDDSGTPTFRTRDEASSIELFYDLFFVANLTSFTNIHPIDDQQTISSYIGFFAILWFTWLQVVLFDVRFGVDSLFERVAKLIHLAVMVTFAIIGTKFDPTSPHKTYATMRQLSMCLFVSRLVLIAQYGSVMLWVRDQKKITRPLSIHIASFAIGGVICMGFFFVFNATSSGQAYIVWYIIIVLEALAVFVSSSQWPSVSFQHTNLSERCGLLTLIILGEGIIVLTKSMNYIVKGENFSTGIIGQIISAVLIIASHPSFMPQPTLLWTNERPNTSTRPMYHLLWALTHFPFHTALVLLVEGTSRFITWRNAMEIVNHIYSVYDQIWSSTNNTTELADRFSILSATILKDSEADPIKYNVTGYLNTLRQSTDSSSDVAVDSAFEVLVTLVNAALKFFHIQAAEKTTKEPLAGGEDKNPYADLGNALIVYDLVFLYFFVAAGLTLVFMALLIFLNKRGRLVKGDWLGIGLRVVVGTGIACVSIVKTSYTAEERFLYSPWMIPTVMLGLGLVVTVDGILGWVLPAEGMEGKGKGENGRDEVA